MQNVTKRKEPDFNITNEKEKDMDLKELLKENGMSVTDFMAKIHAGAIEALEYTEEEIRETFTPEDAEEFIALRKKFVKNWKSSEEDDERFTQAVRNIYRERQKEKREEELKKAAEEIRIEEGMK